MRQNRKIEADIRRAFCGAVPDVLDGILADCDQEKGTVIVMEKKKTNPWLMRAAGIAAALLLCAGVGIGYHLYSTRYAVASTVSLDVNPSIEIRVNEKERVLSVNPKNEDGRTVVGDMDFSGSSLDVTVNALIGSMLRSGYLSELSNSILISVDSSDAAKGSALKDRLAGEISGLLQTDSFSGAVLSQTVTPDTALQKLADQHGISLGKARLIEEIRAQNPAYTFDMLAKLTINELNLLRASGNQTLENVEATGTASDKAYIGVEKATSIALTHANVAAADAKITEAKLDTEDGVMVYEIEFRANGMEYEYDIHAVSGEVVKFETDRDDDDKPSSNVPSGPAIGEDKAKEAALGHAGVTAADIREYKIKLDTEDGVQVYEIEFKAKGYEYDYEVRAADGAILKADNEADDDDDKPSSNVPSGPAIGEDKAKEAALGHAGVAAADVREYKIERDTENGVQVYEIEFKANGYEYDYEVRAADGAILKSHKEIDD